MEAARRAAIVVAGGTGERFGRAGGKQLASVAGRPALSWSLLALQESGQVGLVIVVCPPERVDEYRREAVEPLSGLTMPVVLAQGGATRRMSVSAGLTAIPEGIETVIVHDGARPLATPKLFSDAVAALEGSGVEGVVVGHPSVDTLKVVDGVAIVDTPDRSRFWAVQTPQVFRASTLIEAHSRAAADGFEGTDDAALVERIGGEVHVVEGPRDNLKLTVAEDLLFAEAVLLRRSEGSQSC